MPINVELNDVDFDDLTIKSEDFEIYDVEINNTCCSFSNVSAVSFDRDGDLRVNLFIDEDELVEHISEDVMVKFLENNGYEGLSS